MEWGRREDEILLGHADGTLKFYDTTTNTFLRTQSLTDSSLVGVGCVGSLIITGNLKGEIYIVKKKLKDQFSIELSESGTLNCLICHSTRENIVGTGGESNDFKLWDVNTKQCVFKAKSVSYYYESHF